jgi:hypothetical protein
MILINDSYMGMFMPPDIQSRVLDFVDGNLPFPFIREDELVGIFFLFGKDNKVSSEIEILSAKDLARKGMDQITREVRMCHNMSNRTVVEFIKENYTRRVLQISVELNNSLNKGDFNIRKRISGDPTILMNCFAQHIAHYRQDYFFELLNPFRSTQVPDRLREKLELRMLLLGFNTKNADSLPYPSTLVPFFDWLSVSFRAAGSG